ncbi:hypothetical protein BDR06DRAFT_965553 [Suillus hirtellus]|nr:hypothetical protein BDR06DRAFT_965553 [Suillus hirtellus]
MLGFSLYNENTSKVFDRPHILHRHGMFDGRAKGHVRVNSRQSGQSDSVTPVTGHSSLSAILDLGRKHIISESPTPRWANLRTLRRYLHSQFLLPGYLGEEGRSSVSRFTAIHRRRS